jgi:hypothetical protein
MQRFEWTCPGCQKKFSVPTLEGLTLCPACQPFKLDTSQSPPSIKRVQKKQTTSLLALTSCVILIPVIIWQWHHLISSGKLAEIAAIFPAEDIGKSPVRKWLKDNLDDGSWEEVKWWPTIPTQTLYNANALRLLEHIEEQKSRFERGLPTKHDALAHCKAQLDAFQVAGVRHFCAIKFRTKSPFGGMVLQTRTFEIREREAIPLKADRIVEQDIRDAEVITHDVWDFLNNSEYDPSPQPFPLKITERIRTALVWKKPKKKEAKEENPEPIVQQERNIRPRPMQVQMPVEQIEIPERKPHQIVKNDPPMEKPPELQSGVPKKVREYFERSNELKNKQKELESQSDKLESAIKGAAPASKNILRDKLTTVNKSLVELKKLKFIPFMPSSPEFGDIGSFRAIEVRAIFNDETAIIAWSPNGYSPNGELLNPIYHLVVTPIDAKQAKVGKSAVNTDLFRITASREVPLPIMNDDMVKAVYDAPLMFVAEPVKKYEIEQYREQYQKENTKKK